MCALASDCLCTGPVISMKHDVCVWFDHFFFFARLPRETTCVLLILELLDGFSWFFIKNFYLFLRDNALFRSVILCLWQPTEFVYLAEIIAFYDGACAIFMLSSLGVGRAACFISFIIIRLTLRFPRQHCSPSLTRHRLNSIILRISDGIVMNWSRLLFIIFIRSCINITWLKSIWRLYYSRIFSLFNKDNYRAKFWKGVSRKCPYRPLLKWMISIFEKLIFTFFLWI